LESRLSILGINATLASVELLATKLSLADCDSLGQPQDKRLSTKAPRLHREDGELNPHYPVQCIDRLIRGLQPWPGTYCHIEFPDGKILRAIIPNATPIESVVMQSQHTIGDLLFGDSLRMIQSTEERLIGTSLCLVAKNGILAIDHLQPAGKKLMTSEEFLRGYSRYSRMKITGQPGSHKLLNQMYLEQ